jgi:hypothetical protein
VSPLHPGRAVDFGAGEARSSVHADAAERAGLLAGAAALVAPGGLPEPATDLVLWARRHASRMNMRWTSSSG